jgi:hypothetical protein
MTRLIVVFSVLLSSFADAFGQTTYKHPLPIQLDSVELRQTITY